jgi:hypothetical protein
MAGPVRPYSGSAFSPITKVPGTKFTVSGDGFGRGDPSGRGNLSVNPITGSVTYTKHVKTEKCTIL